MSQVGTFHAGGAAIIPVQTVTGNAGGAVSPDGGGNLDIVGSGSITVTGTPLTNTLTITNSGAVATSFPTDAGTATPALGALTIAGGTNIGSTGAGSTVTLNLDSDLLAIASITGANGASFRSGTTAGNTLLLQAYNNTTSLYNTFATLTSNLIPTFDLASGTTIGSSYIYRAGGTDVPVTDGGTGASALTDHGVLVGSGVNPVDALVVGTNGQVLVGATGADPAFATLGSTNGTISYTTGANSLSLDVSAGIQTDTGFATWGGAGNYFDDTTLGDFTVLRPGTGYINSKLISWTAPQTVSGLTAGNTYFIYIDNTGTLQKTSSFTSTLFQDNIVLFECLRDSTPVTNNQITVKENHPYSFQPSPSVYLHKVVGCVIENNNNGANITLNGTQKIQINGDDELADHGLYTTISDSAGVGVTWRKMYTTAGGKWATQNNTDTFTGFWNNAGTPTALSANRFAVYTLYASKDNLNTTTPFYFAVLDTAQYTTQTAANTAISNGTTAKATNELNNLEVSQLGYIIYRESTASIVQVTISKATLKQTLSTGGTNVASLVTTVTTNFDGILSAADTNVQAALETIDDWGKNATNKGILIGRGVNTPIVAQTLTNGQLLIGNTGNDPSAATLTAGANITITPGAGTITIASTGGAGITTLNGDSGSATGATVTLDANPNAGSTVSFSGSLSTVSLNMTNGNATTFVGLNAGKVGSVTNSSTGFGYGAGRKVDGDNNTAVGGHSLENATTGIGNTAIGAFSHLNLVGGGYNTALGYQSGQSYNGSESSNITISNTGTVGESHVIRIGTSGSGDLQQNKCYIAGINGVNVGSVASVLTNSGDQLGTATITAGTGITVTPAANTITIAATGGSGGLTWTTATANTNMVVDTGYITKHGTPANKLEYTLPASSAVGKVLRITGYTSGGWKVVQAASQKIYFGDQSTTTGASGYLEFTNEKDSIEMVCVTADLEWNVISSIGNITVA